MYYAYLNDLNEVDIKMSNNSLESLMLLILMARLSLFELLGTSLMLCNIEIAAPLNYDLRFGSSF